MSEFICPGIKSRQSVERLDIFGVDFPLLHVFVQNHAYAVGEIEPHFSKMILQGLLAEPIQDDRNDDFVILGHATATHLCLLSEMFLLIYMIY